MYNEAYMILRESKNILLKISKMFPVITVTGPRQSGKTTIVKEVFNKKAYVSLEDPDIRKFAQKDPRGFLNQYPKGAILDEVQRVPDLFSYIQTIVDKNNSTGQFILTGSNQFEYMQTISQSLSGRTGILKLLPFSYNEIYKEKDIDLNKVLFTGFFPRIFDKKITPKYFYSSYLMTYLERDVRNLLNIHNLSTFQNFIELCAGRTGQILNKNSLANECGISNKTIEEWLSLLEASFIIYRLRPYYKNWNKRIIKSPKLYFLDPGFVTYLLGIEEQNQLLRHPLRGEIFETFIIVEFLKKRYHFGDRSNLYYYRDNNQNEIDLIIDTHFGPIPIEIKSGKTINEDFFRGLNFFAKLEKNYKRSGLIIGRNINETRTDNIINGYSNIYKFYDQLTNKLNRIIL